MGKFRWRDWALGAARYRREMAQDSGRWSDAIIFLPDPADQ